MSILDTITNLKELPLLTAATNQDSNPTPPHIKRDVLKLSYSSYQKCIYIMDYLIRVCTGTGKHPQSKIKAVKLLNELICKGPNDVRQILQKEEHRLKPLCNFYDPNYFSELSTRVRDSTKQLLEEMYSESTNLDLASNNNSNVASNSSSHTSATYSMHNTNSKYSGFGNTPIENTNASSGGILSQVSYRINKMSNYIGVQAQAPLDLLAPRRTDTTEYNYANSSTGLMSNNTSSYAMNAYQSVALPTNRQHVPGRAGHTWDTHSGTGDTMDNQDKQEKPSQHTCVLEMQLVEQYTTPGGVKLKPNKDELDIFWNRSKSLNLNSIAELLIHKLSPDQDSNTTLRSLYMLEYLYIREPEQMVTFLHSATPILSELSAAHNSSSAVRNKSREMLSVVDAKDGADTGCNTSQSLFTGMHITSTTAKDTEKNSQLALIPGLESCVLSFTEQKKMDVNFGDDDNMIDLGQNRNDIFDPLDILENKREPINEIGNIIKDDDLKSIYMQNTPNNYVSSLINDCSNQSDRIEKETIITNDWLKNLSNHNTNNAIIGTSSSSQPMINYSGQDLTVQYDLINAKQRENLNINNNLSTFGFLQMNEQKSFKQESTKNVKSKDAFDFITEHMNMLKSEQTK